MDRVLRCGVFYRAVAGRRAARALRFRKVATPRDIPGLRPASPRVAAVSTVADRGLQPPGDAPVRPTVIRDVLPPRPGAKAVVRAYVALTKPRIVELLLVTTVPAMLLARPRVPPLP